MYFTAIFGILFHNCEFLTFVGLKKMFKLIMTINNIRMDHCLVDVDGDLVDGRHLI